MPKSNIFVDNVDKNKNKILNKKKSLQMCMDKELFQAASNL
jgi:hypothetical protein